VIRAAGGLVVREGRVLVVHRPRHDDWSFPKGKLEPAESWEEAALREVEEETALAGELGGFVGRTRYDVPAGPKEVRYFVVRASGEPRPRHEVDEVRWVTLAEARELLSYDYDRELLEGSRLLR
jgi:8-oxo-dGTP pyrophosphatase MutT (NUDIX family)